MERANNVLAGGPGTFSKHSSRYPAGLVPEALCEGQGCYVTGVDGRRYLDTVAALGPVFLGYGHPVVQDAVLKQLARGTSFSLLHPLEVEVAELLCSVIPCAEMVRFGRNGTDMTNAAVRLARAITGHQHVIAAGYHGGNSDWYGITTDKTAGILPQNALYNHQIRWGDLSSVPHHASDDLAATIAEVCRVHAYDDLAAIIVEVPPLPWGVQDSAARAPLDDYARLAHTHGALFILDEIVTWPRYGLSGVQGICDVTPDLCTVSKAMANGLPVAALVGKQQYMERLECGDVFVSTTFAGETTALAAAKAVIEILRDTNALANLQQQGQRLGDGLQALFHEYGLPVTLWGNYARMQIRWQGVACAAATRQELRTLWLAEMARRGILMGIGVIFPQCVYTDRDTQKILAAADEVCDLIRHALLAGRVQEVLPCPVISDVLAVRY